MAKAPAQVKQDKQDKQPGKEDPVRDMMRTTGCSKAEAIAKVAAAANEAKQAPEKTE